MKNHLTTILRSHALPASAAALSLLLVSCKLPSRETWNQVQQRGLIPVLMAANPAPIAKPLSNPVVAEQTAVVATSPLVVSPRQLQAPQQPEIAKTPFATPVPGRQGYVFSPHTPGKKLVDVRQYAAGAEVRCPYTMLPFNVPDFSALAAEPTSRPSPQRSVAEVASRTPGTTADSVPMISPDLPQNPSPDSPAPAADIPYGSRVPGRAGFVYSPFAEKNQLVDVAGIAPGVEVKCPYSGKLFRVPEPSLEEMAPAPATVIPQPKPLPEPAPAPAPTATAPPTPLVNETPTASWSDKEKNLVQSPFGSAGQLIDVTGRTAGSKMPCPFTNKEFIIPAH